ncbi:helix-turn-helix domain-containing protein [Bacillus paramycoides]
MRLQSLKEWLFSLLNRGKFSGNKARKSGKVWLITRIGTNRLTCK